MIQIMHGADLHLDSPFSSLPPEEAAHCRALQRKLPEKIVTLANARGCQLLLLAGDVFDGGRVYPETVQALCEALGAFRGRVFLAPGNHDPYTDDSVWAKTRWPENVHIFREDYEAVAVPEWDLRVHGGAFRECECYEPIAQIEREFSLEIGVYHGEIAAGGGYRPIAKEEIEQCGMDYLALGHIHQRSFPRRCARTWFGWPGVAMGRGFDETDECGVFYVQLSQDGCAAQFVPLDEPVYRVLTVLPGAQPEITADAANTHCRMCFVGQTQIDVKKLYETYAPHYLSLQIVDQTRPLRDLWEACGDGTLRGLALDMLKQTEDPLLAELAAQYLLAALEGGEQP